MSCASLTFDSNRRLTELETFTHLLAHFNAIDFAVDYVSSATFCSEYPCFLPALLPQHLAHSLSFQFIDLPSPRDHLVCLSLIAEDLR